MAVLIDPPLWPAHGTTFAHLVSDVSLAELHAFAESAGLSERAFDHDHYDVPAGRHEELVRRGAEPVSGGELIRRLRASGLRVTARERPEHARETLRVRWPEPLRAAEALRDELLDRWSEPHRHYHDSTHLLAVLDALVRVADGPVPLPVELAAWFHDAVYEGVAGADEEASARLAESLLAGRLPGETVAEVARLVRLTAEHRPAPGDHHGALLCDADLAVLGSAPPVYDRYVARVRKDYAHVDDGWWRAGRAEVLRHLLALDPLYRTPRGQALWQEPATANLRRELTTLLD